MLDKVIIDNFRGIKSLTIDNIRQLNLFLGYNNCGKSSVLEALYLLCDPSHPINDIQINRARNYLSSNRESLSLDFYGRDTSTPISLEGYFDNDEDRKLIIKYFEHQKDKSDLDDMSMTNQKSDKIFGLENVIIISKKGSKESYSFTVEPIDNNQARTKSKREAKKFDNTFNCGYMPSRGYGANILDSFREIIENKEDKNIVETLQSIEPNLQSLSLVGGQIMADVGLKKLLPIEILGDGIRKVLSIIIFIYQLRGGIAMLDEIDNGLHYKSMPSLWDAIITMADKYNVQLFITTHNIDSIKALSSTLSGDCSNFQEKYNFIL